MCTAIKETDISDTAAATTTIRSVDGRNVPAVGTWAIDPTHTQAEFVARHLVVNKVRGGFSDVSGSIVVAEDPKDSSVEVTIGTASISSGTQDRDNHVKSPDFLDVEQFPEMRFLSTSVEPSGSAWRLTGNLTIKDVTKPVTLDFEFLGVSADPWGNQKAAFSASTEIERGEWNLTWNVPLDGGGVLVSKSVKLEIEAQASIAE